VTQAVTAQGQGVGTEAQAVVTHIKGTLPLEGSIWVTIGHCHLHKRRPVHHWPNFALVLIPARKEKSVQRIAAFNGTAAVLPKLSRVSISAERKGKERKGKERKGKERKGKTAPFGINLMRSHRAAQGFLTPTTPQSKAALQKFAKLGFHLCNTSMV